MISVSKTGGHRGSQINGHALAVLAAKFGPTLQTVSDSTVSPSLPCLLSVCLLSVSAGRLTILSRFASLWPACVRSALCSEGGRQKCWLLNVCQNSGHIKDNNDASLNFFSFCTARKEKNKETMAAPPPLPSLPEEVEILRRAETEAVLRLRNEGNNASMSVRLCFCARCPVASLWKALWKS